MIFLQVINFLIMKPYKILLVLIVSFSLSSCFNNSEDEKTINALNSHRDDLEIVYNSNINTIDSLRQISDSLKSILNNFKHKKPKILNTYHNDIVITGGIKEEIDDFISDFDHDYLESIGVSSELYSYEESE